MEPPEPRYVWLGDAQIAYQVFGEGLIDLVYSTGPIGGTVDWFWEYPVPARFMERLASFSRVIMFDARGVGMSDRFPSDRLPTWEDWAEDYGAVFEAVGSERAGHWRLYAVRG